MTRAFKLSTLLRARQVQEDLAKTASSHARSARDDARRVVGERESALRATSAPPPGTARAVVAAIAAQQAMAAGLAAARQAALDSERVHGERMDELAGAAQRRRAVERLAERHAEEFERSALAAEQRAIDEIAGRLRAESATAGSVASHAGRGSHGMEGLA